MAPPAVQLFPVAQLDGLPGADGCHSASRRAAVFLYDSLPADRRALSSPFAEPAAGKHNWGDWLLPDPRGRGDFVFPAADEPARLEGISLRDLRGGGSAFLAQHFHGPVAEEHFA